jgi:hypothetical protein
MRLKHPPAPLARSPREGRTPVPAARRCTLPSVRALLAVGASVIAGGALAVACKGKETISDDPDRSAVTSASSSAAASVASASASASANEGLSAIDTAATSPSAPPSSSAVAAVSCSGSAHVMPHILPSKENHQLAGKPMPVKTPCPPGDPLCDL